MNPKTLTIQLNDEQLPILPVEPEEQRFILNFIRSFV